MTSDRSGWKLLVIGDAGRPIRELHVPRHFVWSVPVPLLAAVAMLSFLAFGRGARADAHAAAERPPSPTLQPPKPSSKTNTATKRASTLKPAPKAELGNSPCAPGMVLVKGAFCPKVKQNCALRSDPEGSVLRKMRCTEYESPALCASKERVKMRYCIDRDEYTGKGETLPANFQSFDQAQKTCAASGKRLCTESEWTFACEGEQMRPYPYGFTRDSKACNIDRTDLVTPEGELKDLRAASDSFAGCVSPFGVKNLSGNVEEFVLANDAHKGLQKGSFWQPGLNHCRAKRELRSESYRGIETGFRCCSDAKDPVSG